MNSHALIWITITITIIVVMMALILSYMDIINYNSKFLNIFLPGKHVHFALEKNESYWPAKNESYWPEPYFMGEYTQNDRERYFDYNPLPVIYRKVDFGKLN